MAKKISCPLYKNSFTRICLSWFSVGILQFSASTTVSVLNRLNYTKKFFFLFRLSSKEQENIGILCKRLLDYGRIQYVEKQGYKASLVKYTSRDITPENIALIVTKWGRGRQLKSHSYINYCSGCTLCHLKTDII